MPYFVLVQVSSASLGKSGSASKGGKGPGSKAKDPIQERKEAQLVDEAQVLTLCLLSSQRQSPSACCHESPCCLTFPFCPFSVPYVQQLQMVSNCDSAPPWCSDIFMHYTDC